MAEVKPVLLDSDGFLLEMDPGADSITVNGLTSVADIDLSTSGTVTNLTGPVNDSDAATKGYVDAIAQGLDIHPSVRVATTSGSQGSYAAGGGAGSEGQLTGAETELDGVSLVEGDRILVKDQADDQQNGLYIVTSTPGTWDRASDMDEDDEISAGAFVFVEEGDTQSENGYVVTSDDPHVLNTNDIEWSQFSGAGQIIAGAGLVKDGNTIDVELATNPGLEFDAGGVAGKLRAKVHPTLELTVSGIGVVGVPNNFEIGGVAVSNNVTGANMDLLTGGGEISLHSHDTSHNHDGSYSPLGHTHAHSAITGVGADDHHDESHTVASHSDTSATGPELNELTDGSTTALHSHVVPTASGTENDYNADTGGVTAGDPVYFSGNSVVLPSDASDSTANQTFGISEDTAAAGVSATIVSFGPAEGVITALGASAGDWVYLANGGGMTLTRPTGSGRRIVLLGTAINADDLFVDIQHMGRVIG